MPRTRDLLRRFRPAGTPGAAASTGVPADRVAELSAELAPVLSRLDDAREQADEIRAAAERDAQAIRADATEQAGARIADADRRVQEERAAAAARASRRAADDAARILERAADEAAMIRARGRERIPALVDRIVATLPDQASDGSL